MIKVISVANQKGGVGKSSVVINLSHALSEQGKNVLLIDGDPQASLTEYFNLDPDELEENEKTLYFSLIKDRPLSEIITRINDRLSIVPSSIGLANAEADLITNAYINRATVLRERISALSEPFDFILIDCQPSLGLLYINALVAAHAVLIPAELNRFSTNGMRHLFNSIDTLRTKLNRDLEILGILPNKYRPRHTNDEKFLEKINSAARAADVRVFDPIHRSTAFDRASDEGTPALVLAPHIPGVQVYHQIAIELIARNR